MQSSSLKQLSFPGIFDAARTIARLLDEAGIAYYFAGGFAWPLTKTNVRQQSTVIRNKLPVRCPQLLPNNPHTLSCKPQTPTRDVLANKYLVESSQRKFTRWLMSPSIPTAIYGLKIMSLD